MLKKMKSGISGKTKISLALAAIALLGTLGYGATVAVVKANEGSSHPVIQVLAERFGLNEDEVEEVFDEVRAEHFAQMQQTKEEMLNQAVEDGVITEEQKQAMLDKFAQNQTERVQHKEEMQAWFKEQGIDHEALMQYGGFGHKRFGHKGM
jgi:DNA-binding transcriptional regulator YhcF (GntR family)